MKEKILIAVTEFFDNTVVEHDKLSAMLGELSKRSVTSFRSTYSLSKLRDFIRDNQLLYTVFEVGNEFLYHLYINGLTVDDIRRIVVGIDNSIARNVFATDAELNMLKADISLPDEDEIVLALLLLRLNLKHCYKCFNNIVNL